MLVESVEETVSGRSKQWRNTCVSGTATYRGCRVDIVTVVVLNGRLSRCRESWRGEWWSWSCWQRAAVIGPRKTRLGKTIGTLRSNYSKLPLTSGHFNPVNWRCLLESSLPVDSTSICTCHVLLTFTSASFSFSRAWCSSPPRPYLALPPTFLYDWRTSPEQPL